MSRPSITLSAVAVLLMSTARVVALTQGEVRPSVLEIAAYALVGLLAAATAVVVLRLLAGVIDPPTGGILLAY